MIAALLLFASTIDDGWPPLRYRGDASAWVQFVAPDLIDKACGEKHDQDHPLEACETDPHSIVLPNPCTFPDEDDYARLACHELAHLPRNGWSDNHPGSRSHK